MYKLVIQVLDSSEQWHILEGVARRLLFCLGELVQYVVWNGLFYVNGMNIYLTICLIFVFATNVIRRKTEQVCSGPILDI